MLDLVTNNSTTGSFFKSFFFRFSLFFSECEIFVGMESVNSSVETVNAAAAAIVTAESRVQPVSIQKRRWGSCWSLYWCFGSLKTSKRISHAALIPEPAVTDSAVVVADNPNPSTSIVLPFIAPPSSPTSFLPSDPPTAIHSPGGLLTLTSLSVNAYSSSGSTHIFTIGPYAHETQLVSPPVFSTVTTEPSTAAITPPPEPVQFTTPSSPEVPFAQLLTSSLNRARRRSGGNQKLALSCYELHHLKSPGSANSASGTSSPYPDKRPFLELRMVDASKIFDSKKLSACRWGSRLGSGSQTPDGIMGLASYGSLHRDNQISEVASLANSETESLIEEAVLDPRVSFELSHEDTPTFPEKTKLEIAEEITDQSKRKNDVIPLEIKKGCKLCAQEASTETPKTSCGEMKDCQHKRSSSSLGSVKEFNFDSTEGQIPADEKSGKDVGSENNWTFFPLLQPGVS